MENDNGLPVFSGPADHLRYGFRSLETEMNASHPVDMMQRSRNESNWNSKLDMVRRTYGSHMAMRLATERATFNRSHRLPRLQSSNIGFETLMGTDTTINFEDFLNDPHQRPEIPKIELHSVMEVKFGIM